MFAVGTNVANGPTLAPFMNEFANTATLVNFCESMRALNGTTQAALLSIVGNFAISADGTTPLANNCSNMFGPGVAERIRTLLTATPNNANNPSDEESLALRAHNQLNSSVVWICDLVNASKKKELTAENVEGYYSSLSRSDIKGGPIAMLINKAANFLPDRINDEIFRTSLTENVWNSYHKSRVSTGSLLFEIRDDFLAMNIYEEGDATDRSIITSKDNPHNIQLSHLIPKKVIGYASLFFASAGKDVGKWYQGEKYEAEISTSKIKTIKGIFKRYLEICASVGNIDDANTVDHLNHAVGNSFW